VRLGSDATLPRWYGPKHAWLSKYSCHRRSHSEPTVPVRWVDGGVAAADALLAGACAWRAASNSATLARSFAALSIASERC